MELRILFSIGIKIATGEITLSVYYDQLIHRNEWGIVCLIVCNCTLDGCYAQGE